jgi:glutamate carboxypeptidase
MPNYREYFDTHLDAMLEMLVRMVELESPTTDKEAVDRYGAFLCDAYRELGATVETFPQPEVGDHRRITLDMTEGKGDGGQITVLCHLDTVWAVGALPIRREGNQLFGPGVYDMKAGTMFVYYALRALREQSLGTNKKIVVLLTSDEEVGSGTSRAMIEEEARRSSYVLCVEPPVPPAGHLKTARKGVGRFNLTITGKASHAGSSHAEGISAIQELAHQILALHALTNYEQGTTVNVGVVQGGTRANVVAAEARAEIDFRVATLAEAERAVPAVQGLTPVMPGTSLSISGGLNRPPMERTPAIVELFERARALGAEFGYEVTEAGTGGGSDAQFAAALGIPTIDGLGANGDGAHALHEHILIDSVPPRAALIAALLRTL